MDVLTGFPQELSFGWPVMVLCKLIEADALFEAIAPLLAGLPT